MGVLLKEGGSAYPKGVQVWLDCAAVKMPQEGAEVTGPQVAGAEHPNLSSSLWQDRGMNGPDC
jgi:hypothetical protein